MYLCKLYANNRTNASNSFKSAPKPIEFNRFTFDSILNSSLMIIVVNL